MTTQVEFRIGASQPQLYACGLLRSALARGARLLVRVPADQLEGFDQLLWTWSPEDFLPHCRLDDGLQARSAIVLTDRDDLTGIAPLDCLVNLAPAPMPGWQQWPRLIEVVGADPDARAAARQRWRLYRDAGCEPSSREVAA